MRCRIIKVACMKFSQQRIAIKTAKVNDEISSTSICCNSYLTFLSHKGRLQQILLTVSTRQATCGPLAKLFHEERTRKILKRSEVN